MRSLGLRLVVIVTGGAVALSSCVLDRSAGLADASSSSGMGGSSATAGGDTPATAGGGGVGGTSSAGGAAPGVGDCVVDPPEVCDDCNTDAGDGCDGQGQVEPGWICPVPGEACRHVSGVVLAPGEATTSSGDLDATPTFEDACAPGMVLVGLEATDSGDWPGGGEFLSFVAPRCAAPAVDPTGRYRWSASTTGTIHGGIDDCCVGNTTPYAPMLCPEDSFVVGYRAWVSTYVTQLELVCRGMTFDGSAAVLDTATTTVGPIGSGVGQAGSAELCPTGALATSLTGSAGAVLDLVGLGCGTPTHTVCGDGAQQGAEACDDGNATSGDGCSALCEPEP